MERGGVPGCEADRAGRTCAGAMTMVVWARLAEMTDVRREESEVDSQTYMPAVRDFWLQDGSRSRLPVCSLSIPPLTSLPPLVDS